MPTDAQLKSQFRVCFQLTYFMLQPVHLICIDNRTDNLYILAGNAEDIEFQITPNGEVF